MWIAEYAHVPLCWHRIHYELLPLFLEDISSNNTLQWTFPLWDHDFFHGRLSSMLRFTGLSLTINDFLTAVTQCCKVFWNEKVVSTLLNRDPLPLLHLQKGNFTCTNVNLRFYILDFIYLIYASRQTTLKAKYLDWQPWKNCEHRDKKQMLILLLRSLKGRFILLKMSKKKLMMLWIKRQYIVTRTGHHCWFILM